LGWSSQCAGSAEEATAMMARHHEKVGLALVDVMLPDMDGMSLARELRGRYPHLEIVLLSGQLNDESRWIVSDEGFRFLPKPFSLDQLRDVVAEILGDPGENVAT
jgi:two-component system cell cycle sensor histidine kinase/response regulator CckA